MERPAHLCRVGGNRLLARRVEPRQNERVDLRIAVGDARRMRVEELDRRQLAVAHRTRHPGGRPLDELRHRAILAPMPMVEITRDGAVCVVTLRREEKLNALSTAVERELGVSLERDDVRSSGCIVFTGAGRAFSAGADVNELRGRSAEDIVAYYRETGDVYERVAALPQPTVSAIAGYCLGAGLELALATDFRIADETAVFGFPEVGIGIIPSSGGTQRLTRLVGTARAKELILLRDRFSAEQALAAGVVTETVAAGAAVERALEIARTLAGLPPLAVALAKQAIDAMPEASRDAGILIERLAYGLLAQTADARR
ncbi:MAG TPA: enoyl-CoA hydratase/isomerase family protein [Gaiellaceae bacterium]